MIDRDKIRIALNNFILYMSLVIIIGTIGVILFGVIVKDRDCVIDGLIETLPDTTYNKITLDSINYNIVKRDSIIVKLNIKFKEDVEDSYKLTDSSTVELFYRLVSAE